MASSLLPFGNNLTPKYEEHLRISVNSEVKVIVASGDMTAMTGDAAVVGEDASLSGLGAVAKAFAQAGGFSYTFSKNDMKRKEPMVPLGFPASAKSVYCCEAGWPLSYKLIYHAVVPQVRGVYDKTAWRASIAQLYTSVCAEADAGNSQTSLVAPIPAAPIPMTSFGAPISMTSLGAPIPAAPIPMTSLRPIPTTSLGAPIPMPIPAAPIPMTSFGAPIPAGPIPMTSFGAPIIAAPISTTSLVAPILGSGVGGGGDFADTVWGALDGIRAVHGNHLKDVFLVDIDRNKALKIASVCRDWVDNQQKVHFNMQCRILPGSALAPSPLSSLTPSTLPF